MAKEDTLTQEHLNTLFEYKEGMLFWKVKPAKQISAGVRAGTNMNHKYRQIQMKQALYLEHRIIWIMLNGKIPEGFNIDHKDHDPSNNKIDNLRLATITQNIWNSKISKNNKSGFKGVSFASGKGKWMAQITAKGIHKRLGYFTTPELASEAYKKTAIELHGEFAQF